MIIDTLQKIATEAASKQSSPLYVRTLLKEEIQNFILYFVYNSQKYKTLLFTGGTCLRKVYGLPRLSEDLDFDFLTDFSIDVFSKELQDYFISTLQYKYIELKTATNKKTVYLKFPSLLSELGLTQEQVKSSVLFVRCDFSKESCGVYDTEIHSLSTSEFTFFVQSYDLATLFANKITAFLKREYFKGSNQENAFKGRDVFDIVWFIEKSKRNNFELKPNWPRLKIVFPDTSKEEIIELMVQKIQHIDTSKVYEDLAPFIEQEQNIRVFVDNFAMIIRQNARNLT